MASLRFFFLMIIGSILAVYPLHSLDNPTIDKDDISQIKRTNTMAPNRPAEQQAAITAMGKECEILFLGDSNTHFWDSPAFKTIWDHYYADRHAINFGIGGDTINDIRSRLRDTQWADCQPPITVILAGTNDRGDQPDVRAKKIKLLIGEVFSHFPHTHVLLVSIPPCGLDENEPLKVSYYATDEIIKSFANEQITFIDLAQTMTWEEGLGFKGIGGDRLHLSEEGRMRWAELMEPTISSTLKDTPREPIPHAELPAYTGDPHAPTILIAGDGASATGEFRTDLQNQLIKDGVTYHLVGPYSDPKMLPPLQSLYFGSWGDKLEVIQKIVPPITKKYAPDVLVLFAGFGEVNYGKNETETIAPRVGTLLDSIAAASPSTQIILCSITPHSDPAKNATIATANENLVAMLKARPASAKPIIYAECSSGIDASMLSQGYLPNKAAFEKIAASVAPLIESALGKGKEGQPAPAPAK